MGFFARRSRTFVRSLAVFGVVLAATAAAAAAINSEGELVERSQSVGNFGVAHADIGVYPDRAEVNPAPERNGGATSISVPAGSDIVQTLVYWAGRGPGWSDDSIVVNGQSVTADIDYRWETPAYDQITYVADITNAGIIGAGETALNVTGADQNGERFYGIGFLAVFENSSQPEVELALLEGNEFTFFNDSFSDEIGEAGIHSTVNCQAFTPSIEDRDVQSFSRIMGVDAGRSDGPPRTQRLQWWNGTDAVLTPINDGVVGIPSAQPQGSIDNPATTKTAPTGVWGSETFEYTNQLAAGDTTPATSCRVSTLVMALEPRSHRPTRVALLLRCTDSATSSGSMSTTTAWLRLVNLESTA